MTTVILEQEADKLGNLTEVVTVCNASGRVLGRFIPVPSSEMYEGVESPVSADELRRRRQEKNGFTTDQVRAFLKNLGEA